MTVKKMVGTFLSTLYGAAIKLWRASYRLLPFRTRKVSATVISVGNITWGGTGKTPMVAKMARDLSYHGKKVAVLIRGYGRDEVEELRKKLPDVPVIVGRDRIRGAREAIRKHQSEFIILDDGFQHIRLHRDIDIVNINATLPFGPGGLLPLGTLREPLSHLSRAHIFMISKSNIGSKNLPWIRQKLLSIQPQATIFEAVHKPARFHDLLRNRTVPLGEVKGRKVATISGIGDPYSFEKTVEDLGAEILFAARYDDHHVFTEKDIRDFITRCAEVGAREVITTEKDSFRLEPVIRRLASSELERLGFLMLQIEFQITDEEDFIRRCLNPPNR